MEIRLGHAGGCGGARKYDGLDAVITHSLKQGEAYADIVPIVFSGDRSSLTDMGLGCEVHDCHRRIERIAIENIGDDQRAPLYPPLVPV